MQQPQVIINNMIDHDVLKRIEDRLAIIMHELDKIREKLRVIDAKQESLMTRSDDIKAKLVAIQDDVTAEKTQIASLSAFIAGLKQQLADALAAAGASQDILDTASAVFDGVEANKADLAAAFNANTPAADTDPNAPGPTS